MLFLCVVLFVVSMNLDMLLLLLWLVYVYFIACDSSLFSDLCVVLYICVDCTVILMIKSGSR